VSRACRTIPASCVEIGGQGILICGGSGAGKTALLVELMCRGAKFVADDGVVLSRNAGRLSARPAIGNEGLLGISPFEVADVSAVFPDAETVRMTSVGLRIQLDSEGMQVPEQVLADVPSLYLERSELTSMADVCERTVKRLLA